MALQDKYKELTDAATAAGISDLQVREQDNVLYIDGDAPTPEVKDKLWSIYEKIDPDFRSADAVIKSVGVCSALGRTSAYTWMKLPVVPDMERVMDSTTFPTLLLGGDPDTSPEETFASWRAALQLPSVRGLVVGRTLLYPDDDDVAGAVDTAAALVR